MSFTKLIKPKKIEEKGVYYKQVTLTKNNTYETVYIPEEYAKIKWLMLLGILNGDMAEIICPKFGVTRMRVRSVLFVSPH